ncbi:four helix bundle protein [Dehalococcoidia bacterium]|nr:four helix bundle protein [Dehalococcoidia bacterium]
MKIEGFEDVEVWQLAGELTRKVYRLTKRPGFANDYGLKRQTRLPDGGQHKKLFRFKVPRFRISV